MYTRLYRSKQSSAKDVVKETKGKRKKLPKSYNKEKKYSNKSFEKKLKKYGQKRTTLRSWEKDLLMLWVEKARKSMEERIKKEKEAREREEEEAKEEELIEDINIKSVDLNISSNVSMHHTDLYDATEPEDDNGDPKQRELIVRRGQPFKVTFTCDRPYEKDKYDMQLVFETGCNPTPAKETLARIDIDENGTKPPNTDNWHARLVKQTGNDMDVEILAPNDCIIGDWTMKVVTTFVGKEDKVKQLCYEYPEDITILLNPWCEDDTCYLSNKTEREEFILNPKGCVHVGSSRQISSKPWDFGQFDKDIVSISLHLLRKAFNFVVTPKLGNPIFISRAIAQIVNACDDDGVLVGNWSGNYEGGRSPTSWTGSAPILHKYAKDKKPVQFGQCWVFSAVTTTVCRAIGLPCRSVTNFSSAHDTDGSVTIDRIYERDELGDLEKQKGGDSIWNFHVWNEVWMERPDLPPGHDGWQVIDATPQELSDKIYTCGPASVAAVKKGEIELPYDTPFIFAEVNSDIAEWELVGNFEFELLKVLTSDVGKKISTKTATGKDMVPVSYFEPDRNRDDVTWHYKHPEGSKEEREAVQNAKSAAKFSYGDYAAPPKELEVKLKEIEGVMIGDDIEVEVSVKNITKEKRTVPRLDIKIISSKYDGEDVGLVMKDDYDLELQSNEEKDVKISLPFERYYDKIREYGTMKVVITGKCLETNRCHIEADDFRIRRPDLTAKCCPEKCKVGDIIDLEVSFKNPIPRQLTKNTLYIQSCLFEVVDFKDGEVPVPDVKPKEEMKITVKLKALKKHQETNIFLGFESADLYDIMGQCTCTVAPK